MEVSCQFHAPAALPPWKEPRYPLDRRLGGLQSRSGRGGEGKNIAHVPKQNIFWVIFCIDWLIIYLEFYYTILDAKFM
jgi:hypothetical protein